jgi:hypothetical protein
MHVPSYVTVLNCSVVTFARLRKRVCLLSPDGRRRSILLLVG